VQDVRGSLKLMGERNWQSEGREARAVGQELLTAEWKGGSSSWLVLSEKQEC
jgi:hypothetical protein